jgi:hypothetical protein
MKKIGDQKSRATVPLKIDAIFNLKNKPSHIKPDIEDEK